MQLYTSLKSDTRRAEGRKNRQRESVRTEYGQVLSRLSLVSDR